MKENDKEKIIKIINVILTIFCLFSLGILSYYVLKVNIIPFKYLLRGIILTLVFLIASFYIIYTNSKTVFKIITYVLMITAGIGSFILTGYLKNTEIFLSSITNKEEALVYSIVVLKESEYERISDLKSKTLAYFEDDEDEVTSKLNKLIEYNDKAILKVNELIDQLLNKEVDAIILESSYLTMLEEQLPDFASKIKEVYSYDVNKDLEENSNNVNLTKESFILYINGVDSYNLDKSNRGISEINGLLVVNPLTKKILFVDIPKNLDVSINEEKEKMANLGLYEVSKSIDALENIYDIKIDNYLKINLKEFVNVIDIIGDITINSDREFTGKNNLKITKGVNHLDKNKALLYSRSDSISLLDNNYAITKNEEVVLAILNKLSDEKVWPKKYNNIINNLKESIRTDIPMNNLTAFIKNLIKEETKWHVEYMDTLGNISNQYVYSLGDKKKLDILEIDENNINEIKNKINNILNAKN